MTMTVLWFLKIFGPTIYEEGWSIELSDGFYVIEPIIRPDKRTLTYDECKELAAEYGWEFLLKRMSFGYNIVGFDINNLKRNKHLLTANELGLL